MVQNQLLVRIDSDAMAQVRRFVAAFVAQRGFAVDEQSRILIMLEELLTNAQKYGYQNRSQPGAAEIALTAEGAHLTIEYADDGDAFNPFDQAAPDLESPLEERSLGGLGIHLMRSLADEACYQRIRDRNVIALTRRVTMIDNDK